MNGTFVDRRDAGRMLGAAVAGTDAPLGDLGPDPVVLGIARGGVVVAEEVAAVLDAPLEVVVTRKIGAPGNPELAIGAIAPGIRVIDAEAVAITGATADEIEDEVRRQEREMERRERAYRGDRAPVALAGRVAVVVDDGLATGATAIASVRWARAAGARRVVLAVPVAPREALGRLSREADAVLALRTPPSFAAVGQWFEEFGQTSDDEVVDALRRCAA